MSRSCYTCRRRRVECDMSQPPCSKCTKAGLECFQKRPLRWVQGAAFRGKPKTASAKITLVSSTVMDKSPLTSNGDILPGTSNRANSTCTDDLEDPSDILGIPPGLDDPSIIRLDKTSRYYLYYYSKCVCKLFIMYDSNQNPMRKLIPAALEEPVLLMSVVALSAQHMANTARRFYSSEGTTYAGAGSADAHHSALLYKHQAIQGLSRAVNDARLCRRDLTVASAFLLIFLDLLESGSDNWNFHLEGLKKLMNSISQTEGSHTTRQGLEATVQELRDFIIRQIYLIDTLGATCTRPRLLSRSAFPQSVMPLQMSVDKAYLGCPDDLLDALRSFSISRDAIATPELVQNTEVYPHIQKVRAVLDSTRNFDCHSWAAGLSRPDSSIRSMTLDKLAQSYKLGSLIYGTRVLDALTGSVTSMSDSLNQLIDVIDALKSDDALFKCVLWPMFVAGLESREESQRQSVIDCLEKFWFETKCINVVNAANILRRFWKQEECGTICSSQWIFNIGQIEGDWLLI
ncbi:C6 transcription factor (Acr-2) [Aspergillus sclerotiicarbonarius CBS 121057]|uniref:C6 transcription factor (Acr-2) n=1 Tax=Aspergillus sclerotiicarbonarius (strain CBS 121057 / IBT 28362) TaxID=1448318 RepID=A0A319DXD5_ASPSB|nr:C6 transcription factor (Acr-2) [Aspergillus sclerotiicarbonarius CBS 121057]